MADYTWKEQTSCASVKDLGQRDRAWIAAKKRCPGAPELAFHQELEWIVQEDNQKEDTSGL